MNSLETEIQKVMNLNQGLRANIVQKEISHIERTIETIEPINNSTGACPDSVWNKMDVSGNQEPYQIPREHTVIDRPRIIKPDNTKRQESFNKLKEIYQISPWLSARYLAACSIYQSEKIDLRKKLTEYTNLLKNQIEYHNEGILTNMEDLGKLFNISQDPRIKDVLKNIYKTNPLGSVRTLAGKYLGYSGPRILLHERLIKYTKSYSAVRQKPIHH